jgi:TPR repeat protein
LYLAAQNNKDAIRDAAKILTYGLYGAEKNVNEATRLYKNLADAGDWISMRSLNDNYTSADLGFQKMKNLQCQSAFK